MQRRSVLAWMALALIVAVADQVTKRIMLAQLAPGEAIAVAPFFNLVLGFNAGAAFGMLGEAGGWPRPVLLAVATGAAALLVHLIHRPDSTPPSRLAYSLILGGAVGNAVDRALRGAVVDWLDFHLGGWHWPAFNLADAAITVGVGVLLAGAWPETRTNGAGSRG